MAVAHAHLGWEVLALEQLTAVEFNAELSRTVEDYNSECPELLKKPLRSLLVAFDPLLLRDGRLGVSYN